MAKLSPANFKVLLCICRQTYGWHREKTQLSLKKIIATTSLSRQGVINCLDFLLIKGLIIKTKNKAVNGGNAANHYEVSLKENSPDSPPVKSPDYPLVKSPDYLKESIIKEIKESKPKKDPKPKKSNPAFSECANKLAKSLFLSIKKLREKFKEPNLAKWAVEIDDMLRIDKRSPEEVEMIISWLPSNKFWMGNCLCPAKLRKHFDTLCIEKAASLEKKYQRKSGAVHFDNDFSEEEAIAKKEKEDFFKQQEKA